MLPVGLDGGSGCEGLTLFRGQLSKHRTIVMVVIGVFYITAVLYQHFQFFSFCVIHLFGFCRQHLFGFVVLAAFACFGVLVLVPVLPVISPTP